MPPDLTYNVDTGYKAGQAILVPDSLDLPTASKGDLYICADATSGYGKWFSIGIGGWTAPPSPLVAFFRLAGTPSLPIDLTGDSLVTYDGDGRLLIQNMVTGFLYPFDGSTSSYWSFVTKNLGIHSPFETDVEFTFSVTTDDGVAITIDGNSVLTEWQAQATSFTAAYTLKSGTHSIVISYFQAEGGGSLVITVAPTDTSYPELPQSAFYVVDYTG